MKNYKQKNLCKNQLDLDDYFMQKIVGIDFNGDTLRVQVKDRADLTFSKVKIDFAALKFFNGSEQDITLYSLYIFVPYYQNGRYNPFQVFSNLF